MDKKWEGVNTYGWEIDHSIPPRYLTSHVLYYWALCKYCGEKEKWVDGSEIRRGKSKSCGCTQTKYKKKYRGTAHFNPAACNIIDVYGRENNYNFKHAMNGGEIRFLNYYVDGYDARWNTVIEIDEPNHYVNWELREADVLRQERIMKYLACVFIRIRIDRNNNIIGEPRIYRPEDIEGIIPNHGIISM